MKNLESTVSHNKGINMHASKASEAMTLWLSDGGITDDILKLPNHSFF